MPGFHVAFGKDKGVVSVKACTNTLACELFVFRLARMLDLNVPTLRPVLKVPPAAINRCLHALCEFAALLRLT